MKNDNKITNKYTKPILIISAILIVVITTIASYAYFTASVSGNNLANNNVITTGTMAVEFIDGNNLNLVENMIPGDYIEKTFSVKNIGTVEASYDIYLNDVYNDFEPMSDLVYELTSDSGANIAQTTCPDEDTKIASNITIGVGQTHNYTLKITFKETGENQDENKDKEFSAIIDLREISEKPIFPDKPQPSFLLDTSPIQAGNITLNRKLGTITLNFPFDAYGETLVDYYFDSITDCQNAIEYDKNNSQNLTKPFCELKYQIGDIAQHEMYTTSSTYNDTGYQIYDYELSWGTKMYSTGETITKNIYALKYFYKKVKNGNVMSKEVCENEL